jgi:poly-gamma-glutamate synthesis protein (capsule biosynthesis protein)
MKTYKPNKSPSYFYSLGVYLFLAAVGTVSFAQEMTPSGYKLAEVDNTTNTAVDMSEKNPNVVKIFMSGDIMTGRGIDQVLPHPSDPMIYESYMKSARGYVKIAERANGPIQQPVSFVYIWGEALEELDRAAPHVKLINLETSITTSNDYWKAKGIHYRMHPDNTASLTAAGIDICSLANNHVLDWGYPGLFETLASLKKVNIKIAGAGRNLNEAQAPAVINIADNRSVIVFSFGLTTSGIPLNWAADKKRPGVNLLRHSNDSALRHIQKKVQEVKRKGDIVVASIHWGSNWGYDIPRKQTRLAHQLIDVSGVDIIHGHSSHHIKAIEVYKNKLILYGCGDFLNDYEGIGGYEEFRADLALMYFATVDSSTGKLLGLEMTPTQIRRFRVNRASRADARWLRDTLNREGARFGTRVKLLRDNRLTLHWE